jgi:uncharacterized protein involved in tolerance to divalent cations
MESSGEWRVQIKTSGAKKDGLVEAILNDHPYETPQIVAWEVETTTDYVGWVEG